MSAYDDLFEQAAKDSNVPVSLLKAIAQHESGMDPKAVSKDSKGNPIAQGIMQFTAPTAAAFGVDPLDPKQAIPAGAKLLRQNLDASNGDEKQALLMYHGGPDQSNWGPKTLAYPDAVYKEQAKQIKGSATAADPVFAFLNGGATKADTATTVSADPVFDFLNSGGAGPKATAKPSAPSQPVAKSDSAGVAQGKRIAAAGAQYMDESNLLTMGPRAAAGAGETALNALTGIASAAGGGLAGLAAGATSLVSGKGWDQSLNDATGTIQNAMTANTYQPRTGAGKLGAEALSVPFNAAKEALGSMGGDVGQVVNGDKGRLVGEALGQAAPDIYGALSGGKIALRSAPAAANALESALAGSKKLAYARTPAATTSPITPPGAVQVPNRLQPLVKVNPDGTVTRLDQAGEPSPAPVAQPQVAAGNPMLDALQGNKPRFKLNQDGSLQPVDLGEPPVSFTPPEQPASPPAAAPAKPVAAPVEEDLPMPIAEPPIKFENASPELQKVVGDLQAKGKPISGTALDRHLEADSLPVKMQLSKGQATDDVNALSEEQNNRGKNPEAAEFFNRQNKDLVANTNAIKEAAAPDVQIPTQEAAGEALIKSGANVLAADHANISALYKKLEDANGGTFPVDQTSIVKSLENNPKWRSKGRYVTPEVKSLLADMKDGKTPMTLDDYEALRTTLAEDMRTASRNGQGNTKFALGMVRDAVENLPLEGATAEVKALADAARKANAQLHAKLNADPALAAIEDDTARPDNFVNKFVVGAKRREAKTFKDNLSADPEAGQVLSAAVVNHLKEAAGLKSDLDNFSQNGYRGALKKQGSKIDDLLPPEQAQQVRTLGNVAAYTQRQPRGSYINNSNSTVASIANAAKTTAEAGANYLVPGLNAGTYIRNKLETRAAKNKLMESLQPGAGIEEKK